MPWPQAVGIRESRPTILRRETSAQGGEAEGSHPLPWLCAAICKPLLPSGMGACTSPSPRALGSGGLTGLTWQKLRGLRITRCPASDPAEHQTHCPAIPVEPLGVGRKNGAKAFGGRSSERSVAFLRTRGRVAEAGSEL